MHLGLAQVGQVLFGTHDGFGIDDPPDVSASSGAQALEAADVGRGARGDVFGTRLREIVMRLRRAAGEVEIV